MPTQQDLIRRDVDLLAQQYRVVLVNFTCLDAEYERLQGSNELREFTAAALPLVQTALREALGDVWCQAGVSWAGGNPLACVTPNGPVGLASRQGLLFLPKNVKRR